MTTPSPNQPYAQVHLTAKEIRILIWSVKRAIATLEMPVMPDNPTPEEMERFRQEQWRYADAHTQAEKLVQFLSGCIVEAPQLRTGNDGAAA